MEKQTKIVDKVYEGQQAVVICLLATGYEGAPIIDSQLDLAVAGAKNALRLGGCEVAASGSAIRFDAVDVGKTAILTSTLETVGNDDETAVDETPENADAQEENNGGE